MGDGELETHPLAVLPQETTEEFDSEEHYVRAHALVECIDLSGSWFRRGDRLAVALDQPKDDSGRAAPFGVADGEGVGWKYAVTGSVVVLDGPGVQGVTGEIGGDKGSRTIALSDGSALTEGAPPQPPPPPPPPPPPVELSMDLSGTWYMDESVIITLDQTDCSGRVVGSGSARGADVDWKYTVSGSTITLHGLGVEGVTGEVSAGGGSRTVALSDGRALTEGVPPPMDLSGKWYADDLTIVTLAQVGDAGSAVGEGVGWRYTKYTVSGSTVTLQGSGIEGAAGLVSGQRLRRTIALAGGKTLTEGVNLSGRWHKDDGVIVTFTQDRHAGSAKGHGVNWEYDVSGSTITLRGSGTTGVVMELCRRELTLGDGVHLTEGLPLVPRRQSCREDCLVRLRGPRWFFAICDALSGRPPQVMN